MRLKYVTDSYVKSLKLNYHVTDIQSSGGLNKSGHVDK